MAKSTQPITVEDLWQIQRFGTPTVSPDGAKVVAAVTQYDMEQNESNSQLWLFSTKVDFSNTPPRPISSGKKDHDPQWSPDGRWIAFLSKRGEGKEADKDAQIYLLSAEGGEARKVAHIPTGVIGFRWFPDGKHLACISWVWPELKTMKQQAKRYQEEQEDKVKAHVLEGPQGRYWDHWFPRGRVPHLIIIDSETGQFRDLFLGTDLQLPSMDPNANLFSISPDNTKITFTANAGQTKDPTEVFHTRIMEIGVLSGTAQPLTKNRHWVEECPSYSPDGHWLAYLYSDWDKSCLEQARIALIDRKTEKVHCLSVDWDRGINPPLHWAANSQALYFTAEDEIAQPIWRCPLNDLKKPGNSHPERVLIGPGYGGVATDLQLSANGKTLVYLRSQQNQPPSLYAAESNGRREQALEKINQPLLSRLTLSPAQSVTVAGWKKEPVQMWIVTPPHFDPKKKWPLLHVIHGGPHTCAGDVWHFRWNMQLFAAQGYVVVAVNYHGSTGWGQAFVNSIHQHWGEKELADIEAGTDYMLATGYIDPDQLFASGGSYGGYMVAYMNGKTKPRYQAYICHAGVFDRIGMMGSDAYAYYTKELGFPWQKEQEVLQQSPHHYAAHFKTPTLILHGELDYRVPYYQGLAYYHTLQSLQVPSRLVFFPDENHWILKPQNSRLWHQEFFSWLQRFPSKPKEKAKKKVST